MGTEERIIEEMRKTEREIAQSTNTAKIKALTERHTWLANALAKITGHHMNPTSNLPIDWSNHTADAAQYPLHPVHIAPGMGSHMHGASTRLRPSLRERLAMRMDWLPESHPFPHMSIHKQDDKVLVWVVTKEGNLVIEDDAAMYPSDALVTKLRLL